MTEVEEHQSFIDKTVMSLLLLGLNQSYVREKRLLPFISLQFILSLLDENLSDVEITGCSVRNIITREDLSVICSYTKGDKVGINFWIFIRKLSDFALQEKIEEEIEECTGEDILTELSTIRCEGHSFIQSQREIQTYICELDRRLDIATRVKESTFLRLRDMSLSDVKILVGL